MRGSFVQRRQASGGLVWLAVLTVVAWAVALPGQSLADDNPLAPQPVPHIEIIPAGCTSCNSGLLGAALGPPQDLTLLPPNPRLDAPPSPVPPPLTPPDVFNPSGDCGCAAGMCYPGRKPCYHCKGNNCIERFCCALYECICCPDPCYEGRFLPLADSAFFVEAVRPVTQQRLRWDSGPYLILPDRSEYFWARSDGMGRGPGGSGIPGLGGTTSSKPAGFVPSLRYNDLVMITEGGNGVISLVTTTAYRNLEAEIFGHASGFADMSIATKTMLFDCELLQFAFMMTTHIPTGNVTKGLGVGHVSLEPTGLVSIKLTPTTYFQGQLSEWIPIAGDSSYQGSILHYHMSLNQELIRLTPDAPLIATAEFYGYSFQDGLYTDPVFGPGQKSSGYTYAYAGFGARFFVCDRIDFGAAASFALTEQHFAEKLFRMEFRIRY